MSKKKKILIWCDTPTVPTGFGIVAKNLFRDLHKDYEVEILGINYHGDKKYDTKQWFIYPAASGRDILGFEKFKKILPQSKPDIILLFQDIFHINDVWSLLEKEAPDAKKIIYFPVDGTPFNLKWGNALDKADEVITYTEFAKQAILDTFPHLKNKKIHILDHGIDTLQFGPLTENEIKKVRAEINWKDKFTIVNINRFQPRKQIPVTLRAGAMFIKGYNVCECGNWYVQGVRSRCDLNGCGKDKIVETVPGHKDALLYLHMVPQERGMGPGAANYLQAHAYNAGFRDKDLTPPNNSLQINAADIYTNPFTEKQLNEIYNAGCVNISTTVGEGFGFSLAEASASGTISIAPKHSAIPEVLGDTAHLVNNVAHFNMAMDNGHMRPIVDVKEIIQALEVEYGKWLNNNKMPVKYKELYERVHKKFNWDDKRKFISDILKKALE